MADDPKVKGVAFRSVFASLGKLRGAGAQQAALQQFGQDLQSGFAYGGIVPGGWYPIAWYKELLRIVRSSSGEGRPFVYEVGRQCTRDDMSGIYSMLAKLITPQSLLSLSQRVFSSYYSVGKVQLAESRTGFCQASWRECRDFDENMWTEITGSCAQLLEIGGARNVRTHVVSGGQDGSDAMVLTAHWS